MVHNGEQRQQELIEAGIDPDTSRADAGDLNAADVDESGSPEAYQPKRSSLRHLAPVSPVYDQQRTPWRDSDRDLVY